MILVVGDVLADVIVRPEGALLPGTDRRASILARPGGSGANVACWLASLGVATRFVGRVAAADHASQTETLLAHGVEANLAADPAAPTGTVVAVIAPDGERSFFTDRGASLNLCADDLPDTLLEGVRLLHVSGHAFFAAAAAVRGLIAAARSRKIVVTVDAGSATWLAEHGAAAWREWTAGTEICFANEAEAALIGIPAPYACFVVTRGAQGASAGTTHVAAGPARVVDSTGAGDAFVAGFLRRWLAGGDVAASLEAGCVVAAVAVGTVGARPASWHGVNHGLSASG